MAIPSSSSAAEIAMRVMEGAIKLQEYDAAFRSVMHDVMRRGSAMAVYYFDDRPVGYSQSHWRKIKKHRRATKSIRIGMRHIEYRLALNTGSAHAE